MARKVFNDIFYTPLPPSTREVVGGPDTGQESEYNIVKFVQTMIPENEQETASYELGRREYQMSSRLRKKQKQRFKKSLLTLKERRELGLYKLRRKDMKYEDFLALHYLWKEYFLDYIDFETLEEQGFRGNPEDRQWENVSRKLLKADYHGSILTVRRSLCSSLVGKKGIVVFDTKNTFQLLDEDNVLRIIPKESSVFTLTFHHFTFTILGNQFCIKPSARNTKKMKTLISLEL